MATRSNYDDPFYNLFSFGEPRTIISETCPTMSATINADGSITLNGTTNGSWFSIPFDEPLYIINGSYAFSVTVLSGASSLIPVTTTPILYQLKTYIELSNRTGTQDITFTKVGALEDYSTYTRLDLRIGTEGASAVEQETTFDNFSFRPTLYCLSCSGIFPGEEGKRRTNFFNNKYNHFPQSGKQTIYPNGVATPGCFPSWYQPGGYHRLIKNIPAPEWYQGQHQEQNLSIYVNSDSSLTINGIIINNSDQPYKLAEPFFYIPTYTARFANGSVAPQGSDYGFGVWGLQPRKYKFSIKVLSDINSIRFYSNPKSKSCLKFTIKIHKKYNDNTFVDPDGNGHITIPTDANEHHEYMRNFDAEARGSYALFDINFYGTIEFNNFTFKPYTTLYSDEQYFEIIETDDSPALELYSVSEEQWGEPIYAKGADMVGSFEGEAGSTDLTVPSIQQNDLYHSPVQLGRLNNQLEQFFDYNSQGGHNNDGAFD